MHMSSQKLLIFCIYAQSLPTAYKWKHRIFL